MYRMDIRGIYANRACVMGVYKCAGAYVGFIRKTIVKHLGEDPDDTNNDWYSLDAVLKCFDECGDKYGDIILSLLGSRMLSFDEILLPQAKNVEHAFKLLNRSYHMLHCKNGVCLYDFDRKIMKEGVGEYLFKRTSDNTATVESTGPYPCVYDASIFRSVFEKFHSRGLVISHGKNQCRTFNSRSCIYNISWI